MKRLCMSCGRRFDTRDIANEQMVFYGETICRECWKERSLSHKVLVK